MGRILTNSRRMMEAFRVVRSRIPPIRGDRRFSEDIKKIQTLIESGELLRRVEEKIGRLN